MTNTRIHMAVACLASRQHNVFSDSQANALGASSSLRKRRRASGRWTTEAHGVYGLPGAVHTWHRRLMTAHLDLGPASVVSHRAAAALQAIPGARRGAPELTVPRGASRGDRWRVHESDVPAGDRTRVDGIPVTSLTRTVLDLASVLPGPTVRRMIGALLVENRLQMGPLRDRVQRNRRSGRRGSAALDALFDELAGGPVPGSELEARLFAVLRAGGLPDPVRQHPLPSPTGVVGWVDAAYPAARLIIEVDGRRWHSLLEDQERDRHPDIGAGLLGWRVIRFTWSDLVLRQVAA